MATLKSKAIRAAQYGLTVEKMDELLNSANGQCNICQSQCDMLNIDHCHNTGAVRGVLCTRCNVKLGCWDDREWMLKAADYMGAKLTLGPLPPSVARTPAKTGYQRKGDNHPRAKITESDAKNILNLYKSGSKSQGDIAKDYGISRHTVCLICNGKSWKHISI